MRPPGIRSCTASTLTTDGVEGVIAFISVSGIATFTFTLLMSRIVTTACEGIAVSPAPTFFLPMMPLTGATRRQSARFFLAMASCDFACATLLWISTHCTSGSEPASCSIL